MLEREPRGEIDNRYLLERDLYYRYVWSIATLDLLAYGDACETLDSESTSVFAVYFEQDDDVIVQSEDAPDATTNALLEFIQAYVLSEAKLDEQLITMAYAFAGSPKRAVMGLLPANKKELKKLLDGEESNYDQPLSDIAVRIFLQRSRTARATISQ